MQIDLSPNEEQRLARHAEAAGYDDVGRFLADQIADIARQPTTEEIASVDETAALQMIRRGEEELAAGQSRDMEAALLEMGRRRGYAVE